MARITLNALVGQRINAVEYIGERFVLTTDDGLHLDIEQTQRAGEMIVSLMELGDDIGTRLPAGDPDDRADAHVLAYHLWRDAQPWFEWADHVIDPEVHLDHLQVYVAQYATDDIKGWLTDDNVAKIGNTIIPLRK